jgi:hypothetical protein
MEFTEVQKEALFQAKRLYPDKGFVPVEDAVPECEELVDANWLRTEKKENGDVAYFLTQRAEAALEINGWLESTKGREN